jgi:hypothetical protein
MKMPQQAIDDQLNAHLHMSGTLRRSRIDIVQHMIEFGSAPQGIAQFHRLCFAQMARTCSSVAKSPRSVRLRKRFVERGPVLGVQLKHGLVFAGQ